jgi:hypothetical protein
MDQVSERFHAGHKLTWIEAVARDPAMTGITVKVAVAISKRAYADGVTRTARCAKPGANETWQFVGMPADRFVGMKSALKAKCLKRLVGAQGLEPWTR